MNKAKKIAHKNMPEEFKIEVKNKGTFDPDFIIGEWIIRAMEEYADEKIKKYKKCSCEGIKSERQRSTQ